MPAPRSSTPRSPVSRPRALALRCCSAVALVLAAATLLACGTTGKGLIPASAAGPLQSDFEAVAQAAQSGEGSCSQTEAALTKTEQDYGALPASVNAGLRNTLHQGIANLRSRALTLCAQPLGQNTITSSTPKTTTSTTSTPTTSTPTSTQTTPTVTTPTTPTSPPSAPGGGTVAPEDEEGKSGKEKENGKGHGQGGTGVGEEGAGGAGAGGLEGGK